MLYYNISACRNRSLLLDNTPVCGWKVVNVKQIAMHAVSKKLLLVILKWMLHNDHEEHFLDTYSRVWIMNKWIYRIYHQNHPKSLKSKTKFNHNSRRDLRDMFLIVFTFTTMMQFKLTTLLFKLLLTMTNSTL